jgi:hypothetical protein
MIQAHPLLINESAYGGSCLMAPITQQAAAIRWFEEIGIDDIPLVGGKSASLCECIENWPQKA